MRHISSIPPPPFTMPAAPVLRVIGYVRVSTDKQDIGPEVQAAALKAEAARRGWELELRREEAASAASLKGRPVLAAALEDLKASRADALAVSKLDRLSRSVSDFARILDDAGRGGWHVLSLDIGVDTTTPAGRFTANVIASAAQYERELIAARTREAMALIAPEVRDRMRNGGRPVQLPAVTDARIRHLRAEGLTHAAIAARLTAEGVPTARGGAVWRPSSVGAVLQRLAVASA